MIDLTEKKALVIGGTSGIGEGIAMAFAAAGASVVATSRDAEKVARVTTSLRDAGATTFETTCDATHTSDVKRVFGEIEVAWGGLDILVNAQGTTIKRPATEVDDDFFAELLNVNLHSVFRCCREGYALLQASGGNVINLASMASFIGLPGSSPYTAAKGGVAQLTKVLAVEWALEGVRVNAIAPGWIITPLSKPILDNPVYGEPVMRRIPMKEFGKPEDVAGAALYLASDLARYVTGSVLVVDGGALAGV